MTSENFITIIQAFVQLLGLIGVLVGASVAIAYALFRRFGEKWIEATFESRLVSYKHEQQKELEQLRFKINALLDRTTKLHQREFEVLPEAWAKLNDAYWETLGLISPFQQYPDLARMSDEHFTDFINKCPLVQWEKDELKRQAGQDRNTYYIKHIYWSHLADITRIVQEAHVYILKNGIFLPAEIKAKFSALSDLVWDALTENQFYKQHEDIRPQKRDKQEALQQRGQELLKNLESAVYLRLWNTLEPAHKGSSNN